MQLRMEEKRIVSGTMDAVRARLAPIRGIPTKQGNLQDPNSVSLTGSPQPVPLP
jgi:protein-histidine N-methyltransferase